MEVCCVGRLSAGAVIPCFACSYLANFVTQLLGFKHERYAISSIPDFDARFLFVFLIAAVCLGLIGKLFALGIKYVKLAYSKIFKNYLLAAAVGAAIVSLLIFALGLNDFEGLSTWMQGTAFKGDAKWYDMPAKYLLTVLTLGAGFQGGEVTPMFDMGASFGSWFGGVCGFDPTFFAAIGLYVFCRSNQHTCHSNRSRHRSFRCVCRPVFCACSPHQFYRIRQYNNLSVAKIPC